MELHGQIIPNHNGLLGHYPGADGMKTGFTCPAGFNVVASATRDGRKLIAVVLGSPNPRERNTEAAALFERGFSDSTRGPKLEDLPNSAQTEPKDMRGEICSRRNAAAVAAEEEEMMRILPPPATASVTQRGKSSVLIAVAAAPQQPLLLSEPVRFDPVPVFVGPKPGWTGPVLAARPAPPTTPTDATAYTTASVPDAATAQSAPLALQGAVKPPTALPPVKKTAKLTWRHKLASRVKKPSGD
jgi:D-alanyl-D-alanine carboxypeptidase